MELQANELRFGNWVNYDGFPNTVLSIISPEPRPDRFKDQWVIEINPPDSFNVTLSDLLPIPLDESWLKRGGFEASRNNPRSFHYYEYYIENDGFWIAGPDYLLTDISYVHQLQNLFFALTGQELEFSPE